MDSKKTLVLGASLNPERTAYTAVQRLRANGVPVVAIGGKAGMLQDVSIGTEPLPFDDVHTVTVYLSPENQKGYYDYIFSLRPKRIIFNPGTENEELIAAAEKQGIEALRACTLVMLSLGIY
jgi:predicted CoA-binding protein